MNNIRKIITERLENARNDYQLIAGGKAKNILSGQISAYQDCLNLIPTPRTKEEILKDFEVLGYVNISNIPTFITLKNDNTTIVINIKKQRYRKYINRDFEPVDFTMQEHKLIHELLECEGWI